VGPLDSYGGTPKAGSFRFRTTAIRSAVADLPQDQILRFRGACVGTWWGQGGAAILMVKLMVKLYWPKKTALPKKIGKSEGTFKIQFRKLQLKSGLKNFIRKVSENFDSVIDRLFERLASQVETPPIPPGSKIL